MFLFIETFPYKLYISKTGKSWILINVFSYNICQPVEQFKHSEEFVVPGTCALKCWDKHIFAEFWIKPYSWAWKCHSETTRTVLFPPTLAKLVVVMTDRRGELRLKMFWNVDLCKTLNNKMHVFSSSNTQYI